MRIFPAPVSIMYEKCVIVVLSVSPKKDVNIDCDVDTASTSVPDQLGMNQYELIEKLITQYVGRVREKHIGVGGKVPMCRKVSFHQMKTF